ncbi:uncharacterized protein LOC109714405 [Ananas comosus]|uniref:Uncharacterized protein LOC109714405 n=1 Tax=Ananas comosus TaxID=4615 RepID=A0A6P5FEB8_ANACO|nr:uncharacterized protein LOC109714405 [Ananas comosus]
MAEVISNPDAGMKRRLPAWMLQAKSENGGRNTENGNKTGRKSETLHDNQDEVKPAIRKHKRRMPETAGPGKSEILQKCRTKQRNNDSRAKDEGRSKVVSCNTKNDGDSRMVNGRDAKKKRKLKRMMREMEMETSSPEKSDDEVDLSVEDLMSIAEEYVNADKEKQCKSSTAKEPNSETRSSSLSVSSNTNLERLAQDAALSKALSKCSVIKSSLYFTGSQTSEVKNPVDELCSTNIRAMGDPARDMLDLFLGPLLRESSVKEQKTEAVETLSGLTTYGINKQDTSREVRRGEEPVMKKKSSLKDKVALFLD